MELFWLATNLLRLGKSLNQLNKYKLEHLNEERNSQKVTWKQRIFEITTSKDSFLWNQTLGIQILSVNSSWD